MYNNAGNNPMLKGYVSNQERDQMRERERKSRSQIAQQAARDTFMEQASGAVFAEPIKVKRQNPQITAVLGEYDRLAPIMCSERASQSLVGADVMPCTPAPVHQDHDHLFEPPPPAPPSRTAMRAPPPPPPPLPPPPPAAALDRRAARTSLPPPPPPPPPPQHAGRPPRPAGRSEKRDRPELTTILQEMIVPFPAALVTPLKVNPPPFQFPRDAPITPLHHTPDQHARETNGPAREEPERRRSRPPPLPPPPPPPPTPPSRPPAAATAAIPSLSEDLTLSEDSDDESAVHRHQQQQQQQQQASGRSQPPARGAGRTSDHSRASPSVSADRSAPPQARSAGPPPPPASQPPSAARAARAAARAASSCSSSESGSESESEESADELRTVTPAVEPPPASPAEHKDEGADSPAKASAQWSLRSIMNKDPSGTPVSSIFDGTPASKLSPHDFPGSVEPADPSSADPDPHDDDISIEELVAQVKPCSPPLLSDGPAPMEMSDSSSCSEPEDQQQQPQPPAPAAPPPGGSSVRSTTGGGSRPRPRLSARSESDSEKVERSKRRPTPAEGAPRRPGRPRVKQKPSPPPPPASESDSDSDEGRPPPAPAPARPPRPVGRAPPSKGSLKAAAPVDSARGSGRGRGRGSPNYPSRELISTTDSSDSEVEPSPRRRPPAATPAVHSSDEDDRTDPKAPAAAAAAVPDISSDSDSDSPPKLDAGGVSTSDANKKSTFIRLFSHRVKKTTPRGRPANSSERSEGHASPAAAPPPPTPPAAASLPPPPPPPPPTVPPSSLSPLIPMPAVPLPPLSRQNGVPVLRCRIEKRLVCRTAPCAAAERDLPPPQTELRTEPGAPRGEVTMKTESGQGAGSVRSTGSSSPTGQKRRRHDSGGRRVKRENRAEEAAASRRRPGSAHSHTSCGSGLAAEDEDGAVPGQTALDKRKRGAARPAPSEEGHSHTTPTSQQESRIESPPTGVREADSSTNPSVQPYDSNVPQALYTNQPFPIPAGDQNQYLKQARRLKRAADTEHDLTLRVIRYTQAVLYFLLTALSMEKEADEVDNMLVMLNDTLQLIKDMLRLSSATYRKQGKRPSHIDRKLQTLLLRCQGLIYLRMFKIKEPEHKKAQRQISDFKNQMLSECLTADGRAYEVPRELVRLMIKCNETQGHLRDWLDYWEQADELMQPAPDIGDFFAEIDRTMGSLLMTSTLLHLVYYIRETTRQLQAMHTGAAV